MIMKRSYRPREVRIKIYNDVLKLRGQGLSYSKIRREIEKIYGEKLLLSTISRWIKRKHSPYNGRRFPSIGFLRPSEELSYIIGVVMGDGYLTKEERTGHHRFLIRLIVKDLEFIEEFARCLGVVLNREPPRPKYKEPYYMVLVGDKTLFELLKGRDLNKVKPFIEHCDECKMMFLRGFFDSEGSVRKNNSLVAYNSNYELLEYVRELLADLDIETTGPYLNTKKWTYKVSRSGRIYRTRRDVYYVYIRKQSLLTFYQKVNFTIIRKRGRLEEYLKSKGILNNKA